MNTLPHEDEILALEKAAMQRWCNGDPSGFLEICAPDVVYFDPFLARRMDGLAALQDYYEALRGKVSAAHFEFLDPKVQYIGDAAVLTYNFKSWGGSENALRWNCTEVFQRIAGQWRIIQTHWSFTEVGQKLMAS